jgi:hypothetical protein
MNEEEVLDVNDQFGKIPFYDEGYGLFPQAKFLKNKDEFLPDQEVYDGEEHKAAEIDIVLVGSAVPVVGGFALLGVVSTNPEIGNAPVCVWESSDPTIATVQDQGRVYFHAAGEVTITATDSTDTTVFDTLTLTVVDKNAAEEEEEGKPDLGNGVSSAVENHVQPSLNP